MKRNEIFEEVRKIFKDVFDDEKLEIQDDTDANDIEDWDSLEQINLLVSIEKQFKIKFNIQEVIELKNVGEIVDLIERKILQ